jgi:hypothetical protein
MPKKGITYIVEVVYLISLIFFLPLPRSSYHLSRKDGSFEVDCVCNVDFAVVYEVVGPLEKFNCFLQDIYVHASSCKEVLVPSCFAPIPSVEVSLNRFTPQHPYVFWKNGIQHPTVVYRLLCICLAPQIESYHVPHG